MHLTAPVRYLFICKMQYIAPFQQTLCRPLAQYYVADLAYSLVGGFVVDGVERSRIDSQQSSGPANKYSYLATTTATTSTTTRGDGDSERDDANNNNDDNKTITQTNTYIMRDMHRTHPTHAHTQTLYNN